MGGGDGERRGDDRSETGQCISMAFRCTSAVKDAVDDHLVITKSVVNRMREAIEQKPVKSKMNGMHSSVSCERIDIVKDALEEILSNPLLLNIVKAPRFDQVIQRRAQDSDRHGNCSRSSRLAAFQSMTSTRPAAKSASVLRNSSACHAGLG